MSWLRMLTSDSHTGIGLVLALGAGSRLNDNVHAMSRYSWLLHCPYWQLRNRIMLEKLFDEAAGCETVVGDVYVVLARFAYHIGHLDFICDTIKPPRLQLDEGVHVAFFGWRRHTVEQEVSMDRRAVRRSQVHGESSGRIPTQVPVPDVHVPVSGIQKPSFHSDLVRHPVSLLVGPDGQFECWSGWLLYLVDLRNHRRSHGRNDQIYKRKFLHIRHLRLPTRS